MQLPGERARRERVDAHGHEVFGLGRVCVHADHGEAALRRLRQERGQSHRLARHHDQAVEVVGQGFRQRFLFAVSQPRIEAMDDLHVAGLHRAYRFQDALSHQVEERRDLAGKVDADPELLSGDEEARREVRSVAERLGLLQDPAARLHVDPGAVVERAVDGPDRDAQALRDLADPRRLVPPGEGLLVTGHCHPLTPAFSFPARQVGRPAKPPQAVPAPRTRKALRGPGLQQHSLTDHVNADLNDSCAKAMLAKSRYRLTFRGSSRRACRSVLTACGVSPASSKAFEAS